TFGRLAEVDVEVLTQRFAAGRQGQAEVHLGPGREALGVGHRELGAAQRPLEQAGDVTVAGEADLPELGVAEAHPHGRSPAVTGSRAAGRADAGLAGSRVTGISPPTARSWPVPWLPP